MSQPMPVSRTGRMGRAFAIVALGEAITWIGLLIGMYLKYIAKTTDLGVVIFGRLHGAMFLVYLVVAIVAAVWLRWPVLATIFAVLAAVPPLVTVPVEICYRRRGYLASRKRRHGAVRRSSASAGAVKEAASD